MFDVSPGGNTYTTIEKLKDSHSKSYPKRSTTAMEPSYDKEYLN